MKQAMILKLIEMLISSDDKEGSTTTETEKSGPERAVVVFANNCILFGYSSDYKLGDVNIRDAQYCYYYKSAEGKNGFLSLAENGPNDGSKVSAVKSGATTVTACCIADATDTAIKQWRNGSWK